MNMVESLSNPACSAGPRWEWQELLQVRIEVPEPSCVGSKAWSGRRAAVSERTGAGRDKRRKLKQYLSVGGLA